MQLRLANKEDQQAVAELLLEIFLQMDLVQMQGMSKDEKIELLKKVFDIDELTTLARFTVAEDKQRIVGVSYSYPAEAEIKLADMIKYNSLGLDLHPDQETWPGEWYLEMIAVAENYRGHGIGKKLINEVIKHAKTQGINSISLNVDFDNKRAKKLYESQGFRDEKVITIAGHQYFHMVKVSNKKSN